MAWIESHQSLLRHRKLTRAASALHVDKYQLIGHLHALWWWGLDNADRSGFLGLSPAEELADAAGFPVKKADVFRDVLVAVGFLERTDDGIRFHNWRQYTWRYYDGQERQSEAVSSGAYGNHKRWHLGRGVIASDCPLCVPGLSDRNRGDASGDIRSESLPHLTSPTNQPTVIASLKKDGPLPLRLLLNLSADEVAKLRSKFPTADINARWNEWILWIEEKRSEREPEDKIKAFAGWLKKGQEEAS